MPQWIMRAYPNRPPKEYRRTDQNDHSAENYCKTEQERPDEHKDEKHNEVGNTLKHRTTSFLYTGGRHLPASLPRSPRQHLTYDETRHPSSLPHHHQSWKSSSAHI